MYVSVAHMTCRARSLKAFNTVRSPREMIAARKGTHIKKKRYEIMEIKHGRAAMLGFLHVIAIEAGVRLPGYLSVSQDLKFSDVPAGCFASLEAVPTAGWLQIMVLT